jgi:hypothetical protein
MSPEPNERLLVHLFNIWRGKADYRAHFQWLPSAAQNLSLAPTKRNFVSIAMACVIIEAPIRRMA